MSIWDHAPYSGDGGRRWTGGDSGRSASGGGPFPTYRQPGHSVNDVVVLQVSGDKAVIKRLKGLERKLRRKVIMAAARTAMRPVLAQARQNAPVKTGALKKAIKLRSLKRSRTGRIGVRVAISEDWFKGNKQFYGAFQEFGYHIGKRDRKLRRRRVWSGIGGVDDKRRKVEGLHYIERAYQSHGEGALRTFIAEVPKMIDREMGIGGE